MALPSGYFVIPFIPRPMGECFPAPSLQSHTGSTFGGRIMKPIVLLLLLATAVMSAAPQTSAQKPKVDGLWYGTLMAPDGTPLDVVLQFQKQASGWTGTFNIGG